MTGFLVHSNPHVFYELQGKFKMTGDGTMCFFLKIIGFFKLVRWVRERVEYRILKWAELTKIEMKRSNEETWQNGKPIVGGFPILPFLIKVKLFWKK